MYTVNSKIIIQNIDDECLVLDTDGNQIIVINETAQLILNRLTLGSSYTDILQTLRSDYQVGEEQAESDLDEIISKFKELNIIIE